MFMYMAAFFMPGWRRAQMKRYGLSVLVCMFVQYRFL